MNIPNLLTASRIALLPLFLYLLIDGRLEMAAVFFLIGSASDALDGFIARRFNQVTELGKRLDPLADKLFILSSFTALYLIGMLPLWLLIISFIKEIVILGGSALIQHKKKALHIEPTFAGKTCTAFQMLTVLLILLNEMGYITGELLLAVMMVTAILLLCSTWSYIVAGVNQYKGKKGGTAID